MSHKTNHADYPDEERLITGIQCNEDEALRIFYVRNYEKVSNYILQNQGSVAQAKDTYQDAFVAVWKNIQSGRFQPKGGHSLDAYLLRVAKNKWIDFLRTPQFKQTSPLLQNQDIEFEIPDTDDRENIEKVKMAFSELKEKCRDLLTRFYYEKAPVGKIAQHFGWTIPTTRNNKYRCLQQLRMILKNKK